jgi:hypothetical protein
MVTLQPGIPAMTPPVAPSSPTPVDLPPVADPSRWPALQRLRRHRHLDPRPWIEAIETGALTLEADLIAVLAAHLDGPLACRLLDCWLGQQPHEPAIPALIGACRDPGWADRLRQVLAKAPPEQQILLLPLLGHQRDAADFQLLRDLLLDPGPLPLRRAALDALSAGLSVWPLPPLRRSLATVAGDLQPSLAAAAIDLLARLPGARADLLRLARHPLDPSLEPRLRRRLGALPPAPLLLLVHGRSGGHIPAELRALAAELEQRRGAPVQLLALTAPQPPCLPPADPLAPVATLVPLLLLPGGHVRQDLPRLTAELGRRVPVRRLPFLGSWPVWQRALAAELDALRTATNTPQTPLLLHHPLQGLLAERFLTLLARRCGAVCLPASFEDATSLPWRQQSGGALQPAVLPLALAANRLTDNLQALAPGMGAMPLLQRPRLRQALLEALEALP